MAAGSHLAVSNCDRYERPFPAFILVRCGLPILTILCGFEGNPNEIIVLDAIVRASVRRPGYNSANRLTSSGGAVRHVPNIPGKEKKCCPLVSTLFLMQKLSF